MILSQSSRLERCSSVAREMARGRGSRLRSSAGSAVQFLEGPSRCEVHLDRFGDFERVSCRYDHGIEFDVALHEEALWISVQRYGRDVAMLRGQESGLHHFVEFVWWFVRRAPDCQPLPAVYAYDKAPRGESEGRQTWKKLAKPAKSFESAWKITN